LCDEKMVAFECESQQILAKVSVSTKLTFNTFARTYYILIVPVLMRRFGLKIDDEFNKIKINYTLM